MYLVRIGYRTVNLEFLIETIDSKFGAPVEIVEDGMILVSVYPGDRFKVGGDAAAHLRLHIEDNLAPLPPDLKGSDRDHPGPKPKARPRRGREPGSSSAKSNP